MRAAPGAMLDDGLLEVVVLENVSKLRFLTRILPKVFSGTHVQRSRACTSSAPREVAVTADRPFTMYADGDPIGELPVRVRALPGRDHDADSAHDGGPTRPFAGRQQRLMRAATLHGEARARPGRRGALAPAGRRRHERAGKAADAPAARRDRRRSARACGAAAC